MNVREILLYLEGKKSLSEFSETDQATLRRISLIDQKLRPETSIKVPNDVDKRFYQFLSDMESSGAKPKSGISLSILGVPKIYLRVSLISFLVILAVLSYLMLPSRNEVPGDLSSISSPAEKISYIHKHARSFTIDELQRALTTERNPNTKMLLIDILETKANHNTARNILLNQLNSENTPSIQMAMLLQIGLPKETRSKEILFQFVSQPRLEPSVKHYAQNLLSKEL